MRGYPEKLIMSWCKKNIQERWEKRYDEVWNWFSAAELGKAVTEYWSEWYTRAEKGEFSISASRPFIKPIWNWFSAAELGKAVTEYWSEWYTRAENGDYSISASRPFIKPSDDEVHGLDDVKPDLFAVIPVDGEDVHVPDLRKIGLLGSRWIVSRKRNTNLFDLANVWKKTVFRKLDENIAEEGLLGSRWIVSRKRNTNLFDLANVWKKTVFRKLDENIAEQGGVVPLIQDVDEDHHSD
ncbi:hypothetical protein CVT25_012963, partial [Psilocybe cyanescens]